MWKKHKKELMICALAPILIVILLLIMVWIFDYLEIHVPGSHEMWIGLIGAVIGGAFTYMEVSRITEKYREKQIIEICDMKQPILINENAKSIQEAAREYVDYEVFCKK